VDMDSTHVVREMQSCTAPDVLRWTSDFLDLAGKAFSMLACVRGLDRPADPHPRAQEDLRAWATYLEDHPWIAAQLEAVSIGTHFSSARLICRT